MAMPETAVDEYYRAIPGQLKVGATREVAAVGPESEASGKEALADEELGLGVGAVDTGHHPSTGGLGDSVHGEYYHEKRAYRRENYDGPRFWAAR